jgi:ABC-2 type transport system permease protein
MKNSTLILLKAQFLNQSGVNTLRYENDKKKKNRIIIFGVSMTIIVIMLTIYSFGIAYGLGSIGLGFIIPEYAFTITSLLVMFFTVFKASGILFAFKDYDMLMALPVQTTTVITSRFLLMYGMNALFSIVIMLPMGISYCLWTHPQMLFYLMWLSAIFVTPLVPMTIATVLGSIISGVSSRFKHTNVISIVLSFGLLIAFMGLSMYAGTMNSSQIDMKQVASIGTMLSKKMNQIYPLVGIFEKAVSQNNIVAFLAFLAISGVWYYVFVKIVSIKYKAINTGLTTHQTKSNYKLQSLNTTSPFNALYQKEIKRFFSSYIYVLNVGVGAVLLLIGSITCFVLGIDKMQHLMGIENIKSMIINFAPFVISGMLAMTCTTAVSLSLEGKNLWVLQSAPIDAATIYRSKMAVNISILLPVSILSSIFMSLCLKADIMSTLWMFITPLAYVCFTSVWGIFINIKMPNFTWESEVTVIKQSMASMLGMMGGMLFGIMPIGILMLLAGVDRNLLIGVITFAVIGITVLLYRNVCETELPS